MRFIFLFLFLFCQLHAYKVLVDLPGSMTFEEVSALPDQFKDQDTLFFGNTDAAVWIRFPLENAHDEARTFTLQVDHPVLSSVQFYRQDGNVSQFTQSGFQAPLTEHSFRFRNNVFQTPMAPGATAEIYIRIQSSTVMALEIHQFDSMESFYRFTAFNDSLTIAMLAILFAFLIYNTLICIVKREKVYRYYILYLFFYLIFQLHYSGYMHYLLDLADYYQLLFNASIVLFFIFIYLFMYEMLEIRTRMPQVTPILRGIILLFILIFLFSIVDNTTASFLRNSFIVPLALITLTTIQIMAVYKKVPYAVCILIGWTPFILSMIYSAAYFSLGFDFHALIGHSMLMGSVLEVIIFSMVVALKMRHLKREVSYRDGLLQLKSKEAQMGQILGMIAHQWKQPLASINAGAAAQITRKQLGISDPEQSDRFLQDTVEQVNFLSETIDDFRSFFKYEKTPSLVSIDKPLNKALTILKHTLDLHHVTLDVRFQNTQPISIFVNEITQVLLNIIKNADDQLMDKKVEDPRIIVMVRENDEYIEIEICDNGGGIPVHLMESIFESSFSTKDSQNGTGLGLYMAKRIIEEHHQGEVLVYNRDKGACFIIRLPYDIPPKKRQ